MRVFTNSDVRKYSNLLNLLNRGLDHEIPNEYVITINGGGHDGIPHFKLLENAIERTYVIWVRGTDFTDPNDIYINIRTTPVNFYQGQCHGGYHFAGISMIGEVQPHIRDRNFNRIVCIGHSLGGAVASVIATIFQKGGYNRFINNIRRRFVRGIYALVYGTPPTFSIDICRETRNFITNIILRNDIVPKLGHLFDSLARFQARIVTHFFYYIHGIYNLPNERELRENLNEIMERGIQTNRIPGNVIILDAERRNIVQGENQRIIVNRFDYIGIFYHVFKKYYDAVVMLIQNINNRYIEENIDNGIQPEPHQERRFINYLGILKFALNPELYVMEKIANYLLQRNMDQENEVQRQQNRIAELHDENNARALANILLYIFTPRINIVY